MRKGKEKGRKKKGKMDWNEGGKVRHIKRALFTKVEEITPTEDEKLGRLTELNTKPAAEKAQTSIPFTLDTARRLACRELRDN